MESTTPARSGYICKRIYCLRVFKCFYKEKGLIVPHQKAETGAVIAGLEAHLTHAVWEQVYIRNLNSRAFALPAEAVRESFPIK